MNSKLHLLLLALALSAGAAVAQVPGIISHQGRIAVNGVNFTGTGQFKFALVNAAGDTTHWSNDGSSAGGAEPAAAVSLAVDRGIFSVNLGDTSLVNMTVIPTSVFNTDAVYLRVWFNDGVNGWSQITPDRRLTSVGYAFQAGAAATVPAGGLSGTVPLERLPATLMTNNASDVTLNGAFTGNGAGLTNVNAASLEVAAGNSIADAINHSATTATINSDRLSTNLLRLNPAAAQTSTASSSSTALLDAGGTAPDATSSDSVTGRLRFNFDGGLLAAADSVGGAAPFGTVPATGEGARMMWYPGKAAFRAGQVASFGSTYWDEANIGFGSAALGENSRASGSHSFAAGLATTASGDESVALGNNGTASADRAFSFNGTASAVGAIALGSGAQAVMDDALALGPSSIAGGLASVAIGPSIANGSFAYTIGLQNRLGGNFSFGAGKNVCDGRNPDEHGSGHTSGYYSGTINLGDASVSFSSQAMHPTANNQFNVRAAGGIRFFTSCCDYTVSPTGVQVPAGGSAWMTLSDRNSKDNILPVNPRGVLHGVLGLPISTWNYKAQDVSIRHMGPMAQDFYAAFNIGDDPKHISTIDPDGVALAAIQGLYEELKDRDAKISEQEKQLRDLQEQVKQQQSAIEEIRKMLSALNPDTN